MEHKTDFDGKFTISNGPNAVLVFSYIGLKAQEVNVAGKLQ
jgi:iron complex outermembrane receptor protein